MTSTRADVDAGVAVMTSVMTSISDPAAHGVRERVVQSSPKLQLARKSAWSISGDVDQRKMIPMTAAVIGATLKARGKATESLTDVWRHVEGQMMMIPTVLCRLVKNLHGDISFVLIKCLMWKI